MRFKKFVSLLVAVCLGAGSMISAGAIENTDLKVADVSANKTIDVDDALLTLQYSLAKIRKFPTHDFEKNIFGDLLPDGKGFYVKYGEREVLSWFNNIAQEDSIPVMFETFKELGGFPYPTSRNSKYFKKTYFLFFCYDYTSEYPIIEGKYLDDINLTPDGYAQWKSFFKMIPEDKRLNRDLESEFASAFTSDYEDVMQYGTLKTGDAEGTEYIYWDGVANKLSAGFVFKKDGYVILFMDRFPEFNIKYFTIDLIPLSDEISGKPIMQKAGDVNGDGKIDAEDALMILQYAVGRIDDFSEPPRDDFQELYPGGCVFYSCYGCRKEQNTYGQLPEGWIFSGGGIYCPDCQNKIQ